MNFATKAQALAAGFQVIVKADGVPYDRLLSHASAPGILFRLLSVDDDLDLFRGFAALTTGTTAQQGLVVMGAGRYRQQGIDGTVGIWGPGNSSAYNLEYLSDHTGSSTRDLEGGGKETINSRLRRAWSYNQQNASWETNPLAKVHLGMIVPSGDVIGVIGRDKFWRFKFQAGNSYDGELNPSISKRALPANQPEVDGGAGGTVEAYRPADMARQQLVRVAPNTKARSWSSMIVMRAVLKFGGRSQAKQIDGGLSYLASQLPDDVPQGKVDEWLRLADEAKATRPAYMIATDDADAEVYWTLTSIDGAPWADLQLAWDVDFTYPHFVDWQTDSPKGSGQPWYVRTSRTPSTGYSGPRSEVTNMPLVFNGCLLELYNRVFETAIPESLQINGAVWPVAKLLGQTAVLMQPATGLFSPDARPVLDMTTVPTTPVTSATIADRKSKQRANVAYELEAVFVKHGPVVGSLQYCLVEADRGIS